MTYGMLWAAMLLCTGVHLCGGNRHGPTYMQRINEIKYPVIISVVSGIASCAFLHQAMSTGDSEACVVGFFGSLYCSAWCWGTARLWKQSAQLRGTGVRIPPVTRGPYSLY